jgi:hypothetical protein
MPVERAGGNSGGQQRDSRRLVAEALIKEFE